MRNKNERGFTLVELLTVVAILGVLAKLALTSFIIYKSKAEFAKAESLYQNARTAAEAGEADQGPAFAMAFTESLDTGAPLAGDLRDFFPQVNMPKDVILGASVAPCAGAGLDPYIVISVKACKGEEKHIEYVRFCNGMDSADFNAAGTGC